ncbi:hypothetical protein RUM44_005492 [Polyplax serrata]|uniref:Uncharacterized protein n=1 Tax=Polyplax serrata TaxID=468196 RepID=A0ABR1ADJ3_POLSC
MATINNNKESFELLRGSLDSNSDSDPSEIIFPVKKKRFRRRLKNNTSNPVTNECPCRIGTVTLVLFCILLICWLLVLTWLTVVLHSELNRLSSHVSKGKNS